LISTRDSATADGAKKVSDMHAMIHGRASAAPRGSKNLAATAKVAMEYCNDGEAACQRHADKHPVCKECAEACAKTIAACQKAAA
jgi:hypothetical protein